MIRTYKRKLILSTEQSNRIASWIGACRVVYNLGMEIKNKSYKDKKLSVSKYDLMKQLPDLKQDYDWIKDVPSQSLQAALDRLENSYKNFFRGGGYPKFASKNKYNSILLKSVSIEGRFAIIPKIGAIKMFKDAEIKGTPKTATIIKDVTGFFICIQCNDVPKKFDSESQTIGLDMGIANFCADSNGGFISNPRHFKKYERLLRIENRSLARKKKGSNRWKAQAKRLAVLHHKIADVRKDFLHKESTKIAKSNSVVFMEDLNIKNMSKNKNLSKHILDAGWGLFKTMMSYKTEVVLVNPQYTSQTCSNCGAVDSKSRKSQSEYECTTCGFEEHADTNAAKDIKSKGIALSRKRKSVDYALALEPLHLGVRVCQK